MTKDKTWTIKDTQLIDRMFSLKFDNETDNAYCKRCGLDPSNITRFRKHERKPGPTYLRKIAFANKVSIKWLMSGQGDKEDPDYLVKEMPDAAPIIPAEQATGIDPDAEFEIEILRTENQSLKNSITTMQEMMLTMRDILTQNQTVLQQNAESLSQNRALMSFLTDMIKKQ